MNLKKLVGKFLVFGNRFKKDIHVLEIHMTLNEHLIRIKKSRDDIEALIAASNISMSAIGNIDAAIEKQNLAIGNIDAAIEKQNLAIDDIKNHIDKMNKKEYPLYGSEPSNPRNVSKRIPKAVNVNAFVRGAMAANKRDELVQWLQAELPWFYGHEPADFEKV